MVVDRLAMLGAGGGRPQDDSGLKSWWRHGLRHLLGYWHCPTPPLPQDEAVVACSQRCLSCLQRCLAKCSASRTPHLTLISSLGFTSISRQR
ncbi:hypothetical protein PVAP13_7KG347840 [Panicum virgatum]|uniref:Uncharacterized protein n=1 Tax=Panicum virgatum TaxID=38727 RepID=A0A8T0QI03_PANVG|nr:hypothetical protein PVAP13_7KG347840 [Panicum virgatum]